MGQGTRGQATDGTNGHFRVTDQNDQNKILLLFVIDIDPYRYYVIFSNPTYL
jgi:hypothetical protein